MCLEGLLEFGGVLAGEDVGLDYVQDVDCGAAGAGEWRRDGADLAGGGPATARTVSAVPLGRGAGVVGVARSSAPIVALAGRSAWR